MPKLNESETRVHEASDPEPELCEHGYPEGHGCSECEYWQRVDYEYDRLRDK